jgi:predicted kinase
VGSNPTGPKSILSLYLVPRGIDLVNMQASIEERKNDLANPYHMFKYSVRFDATRNYYERRIKKGGEKFYNHNFIKINYPDFL